MALMIHSVVNSKSPGEEFVWLNTNEAVNLKGYALVDRTFAPDGKISNEFRHIFVFPSLAIGKDDWVRLYTGTGKYSKVGVNNKPGSYIHNLYWESDKCVWNNNGGDVATLIKYSVIDSEDVKAVP